MNELEVSGSIRHRANRANVFRAHPIGQPETFPIHSDKDEGVVLAAVGLRETDEIR